MPDNSPNYQRIEEISFATFLRETVQKDFLVFLSKIRALPRNHGYTRISQKREK